MPPLRIEVVGHTYHVNSKAVDATKLFRDDVDRQSFVDLLAGQAHRSDWCVLAYTLMPNHFHAVIRLRELTLSTGFQRLKSVYARWFNRRHGRRGALWQCRFFDTITESDPHLFEVIRYVALNAPRANLCATPEDWPWSSYGASIGVAPRDPIVDEDALLGLFGTSRDEARRALRGMVEEADPRIRRSQTRVRHESDSGG
jgi:REP element-mobilizing transposase RayT